MNTMQLLWLASLTAALPVMMEAQVSSVTVSPAATGCSAPAVVRVNSAVPAPTNGLVVQLTSNIPSSFPVPASVTIPGGATTASVDVRCVTGNQPLAVTVTAATAGGSQSAVVNVLSPVMSSISVKPFEANLGNNTMVDTSYVGNWSLAATAPPGGVIVTLTASPALVTLTPSTVTALPSGATATTSGNVGSFTVTAFQPVAQPTVVTLIGTALGVSRTTSITLRPPLPLLIEGDEGTRLFGGLVIARGGTSYRFIVSMSGIAPQEGGMLNLSSSNPAVVTMPATAVFPGGTRTARFYATVIPQTDTARAQITVTAGGVSRQVSIMVPPTILSSVTINSANTLNSMLGGLSTQGHVNLSAAAPAGGISVRLSSSSTLLAVPASVTVPAGSSFVAFGVVSKNVSVNTPVTVTATSGSITKTASVALAAEGITNFTLSSPSVVGGVPLTGRLFAQAGHDGFTVSLTSSSDNVVVPATVTFAANETSKTFPIATTRLSVAQTFVIYATAKSSTSLSLSGTTTLLGGTTTIDKSIDPSTLTLSAPVGTATSSRRAELRVTPPPP